MSVSFTATNFAGGSRSEEFDSSSRGGIFQQGVKAHYPSTKKVTRLRVLPAFDRSLSINDAAFPYSYIPYRDRGIEQDRDTKSPGFTSWYLVVREYTMVGNSKFSFLSPQTLADLGAGAGGIDVRDPMQIIRRYAKDNLRWKSVHEAKIGTGKQTSDVLPPSKSTAVVNVVLFDERTQQPTEVAVTKLSWTALGDLKDKLSSPRPAGQNAIDGSEWGNEFMMGDITAPLTGLVATMQAGSVGTVTTSVLNFSSEKHRLVGIGQYPIDPNTPIGREILSKRYDLFSDKTLKAITPQEIVDWVVGDGLIPYELIQEALGSQFNIPPAPARATVSSPTPPAIGGFSSPQAFSQPAVGGFSSPQAFTQAAPNGFAPPTQSNLFAPIGQGFATANQPGVQSFGAPVTSALPAMNPGLAALPQRTAEEDVPYNFPTVKFWVSTAQGVVSKTKAELTTMVTSEGFTGAVMSEDQTSGWKKAADFGIVKPAPVAPPAPPAAPSAPPAPPAPPAAPLPPAAPTVPTLGQTTAVAGVAPVQQMTTAQSPASPTAQTAGSALTPEEQAKLQQYIAAVAAGTMLPATSLKEYGELMLRFSAKAA
jgi:hypothetical protein